LPVFKDAPIGIFDSGVGGLSVLNAIWHELPNESALYLADQAHVPYGPRPMIQVRSFAEAITQYLLNQGAKLIVVACNTASAAALHYLRQKFPNTPFVGMEPAVKPAAQQTTSGVVGILATPATFQGALYASVVERFANGVQLLQHTCPGLVQQIESGQLDSPLTHRILEQALQPMVAQNIDTIVLGCTHYPFVIPLIQSIVGPQVQVIDPAPAVARQARRLLVKNDLLNNDYPANQSPTTIQFLTTGDPNQFQVMLRKLLEGDYTASQIRWQEDKQLVDIPFLS
jgi:glutamate racemase